MHLPVKAETISLFRRVQSPSPVQLRVCSSPSHSAPPLAAGWITWRDRRATPRPQSESQLDQLPHSPMTQSMTENSIKNNSEYFLKLKFPLYFIMLVLALYSYVHTQPGVSSLLCMDISHSRLNLANIHGPCSLPIYGQSTVYIYI